MNKIIIGLIIMVLLSGIVNAECEKEKEKLDVSMNDYNTIGVGYIDGYNKTGNTEMACGANVEVNNVWLAYKDLFACYYEAGNRSLALEMEEKMKEWGKKDTEWEGKCYVECVKEKDELGVSMNDYNTIGVGYMDDYNKTGNTEMACGAISDIGNVWRAYEHLSTCYYEGGNSSLASEMEEKMKEWGEKRIEWGGKCGGESLEEERADVYNTYVYFYEALKEHDCNLLNKSPDKCYKIYNDNSNKSCYYCKEYNKYTKTAKRECKYDGCPPEDSQQVNPTPGAGNKGEGIPVAPIAIGGIIALILISAFFLLKGKKRKAK